MKKYWSIVMENWNEELFDKYIAKGKKNVVLYR